MYGPQAALRAAVRREPFAWAAQEARISLNFERERVSNPIAMDISRLGFH